MGIQTKEGKTDFLFFENYSEACPIAGQQSSQV
jgi:hypothetical protein